MSDASLRAPSAARAKAPRPLWVARLAQARDHVLDLDGAVNARRHAVEAAHDELRAAMHERNEAAEHLADLIDAAKARDTEGCR